MPLKLPPTPTASARLASLHYISTPHLLPGITRLRRGSSFTYLSPRHKPITDPATLARIKSLAIPPAWKNVWICPSPNGHLQALGLDARNRKQYRYHPRWREVRDETKFARMLAFAKALPKIRKTTARHLKLPGLPRRKALAAIVQLLEKTLIRVGNEEYAKTNHSYGLTTIKNKHVRVSGATIHFQFRGKSGVDHDIDLTHPALAKIVAKCQHLPGQELFEYLDENGRHVDLTSTDVNAYLKEIAGDDFTAKDFRTWAGTVLAARALREIQRFDSQAQAKKNIVAAVESVAKKLGNTKAVCRKCYIHPAILSAYLDGSLLHTLEQRATHQLRHLKSLSAEEAAILAFLQENLKRPSPQTSHAA